VNDVVTDGPGKTVPTGEQFSAADNASANPRTDRDGDEVRQTASEAKVQFREHSSVRIIYDPDRKAKPVLYESSQLEACPAGKIVGRGKNGPILSVDRSGAGNAQACWLKSLALGR
jgi:hypothetical protein